MTPLSVRVWVRWVCVRVMVSRAKRIAVYSVYTLARADRHKAVEYVRVVAAALLGVEEFVAVDALVELEDEVLRLNRKSEQAVEEARHYGLVG